MSLDEERIESIKEVLLDVDRYRLVLGHLPYEVVDRFSRRPFVFTVLRDPVDRAVSTFYYMKRRISLPKSHDASRLGHLRMQDAQNTGHMTLLEFIRNEPQAAARQMGNLQVEYLGVPTFRYNPIVDPSVSERDLEMAKERLSNCDAFGLVERVPETLEYLAYALRARPFDELAKINQTRSRPALEEIDPETRAALEELTRYDRQLYTFATQLFEQRRSQMLRDLLTRHAGHEFAKNESIRDLAPSFIAGGLMPGEGWYAPENNGAHSYNWTGPGSESWVELASPSGGKCTLQVGILHALKAECLAELQLHVNGTQVTHEVHQDPSGHMVTARVPASILRTNERKNKIVLYIPDPSRPCDSDPTNDDSRVLGVAVYHISLTADS